MNFDGLVEFRELDLLEKGNCLSERILARFDLLERSLIFLAWFSCHVSSLVLTAAQNANERTPPTELFGVLTNTNTNEKVAQAVVWQVWQVQGSRDSATGRDGRARTPAGTGTFGFDGRRRE